MTLGLGEETKAMGEGCGGREKEEEMPAKNRQCHLDCAYGTAHDDSCLTGGRERQNRQTNL